MKHVLPFELYEIAAPSDEMVMLYRGDSTKVEKFTYGKTDINALFGPGLYLTSSPEIAKSYTSKGAEVFFGEVGHDEGKTTTPEDAVATYLTSLRHEFGSETREVNDKFDNTYPRPRQLGASLKAWEKRRDQNLDAHCQQKYGKSYDDVLGDKVKEFIGDGARYEIVRVGKSYWEDSWKIADRAKMTGDVSAIEVPKSLVDSCYDGDAKIDKRVKEVVLTLIDKYPGSMSRKEVEKNMKNTNYLGLGECLGGMLYGFRYWFSGWTRKTWQEFHRELEVMGHKGIRYEGGRYVANSTGDKHEAYVFWDVREMQKHLDATRAKSQA